MILVVNKPLGAVKKRLHDLIRQGLLSLDFKEQDHDFIF